MAINTKIISSDAHQIVGYLLWVLSLLFAARVIAQAIQFVSQRTWLPHFAEFQGSNLPYWLLVAVQIIILFFMMHFADRVRQQSLHPTRSASCWLIGCGWIYLAGSLLRILIGLNLVDVPSWFTSWISAFFHLVLASYVLLLGYYYRYLNLRLAFEINEQERKDG